MLELERDFAFSVLGVGINTYVQRLRRGLEELTCTWNQWQQQLAALHRLEWTWHEDHCNIP